MAVLIAFFATGLLLLARVRTIAQQADELSAGSVAFR
jgi:hypothetical protein